MSRRRWNFSVLQLLLLTALCALCAGVVATSRQAVLGQGVFLGKLLFSPDGRWLAACSYDGGLRVWDLQRRRLHAWHRASADAPVLVGFSGATFIDQDTLVILRWIDDWDPRAELVFWDARRNQEKRTIQVSPRFAGYAVSPAGNLVASGGSDEGARSFRIEFRDLVSGELITACELDAYPEDLMFSSDGKTLAVSIASSDSPGGLRYHVQVWDSETGSLRSLRAPIVGSTLVLSGDGKHLLFHARDGATVWDVEADREVVKLKSVGALARFTQFSPDGRWLMACSDSHPIGIWNVADGAEVQGFPDSDLARERLASRAAFSPDGRWIVTGSDARISLWDARTFAHVADLYHDPRIKAGLAYVLGFVAWAALMGGLARRQRARQKELPQPERPAARRLPPVVRAALHPQRTWGWLLLTASGVGAALVWLFAGQGQRDWSHPANVFAIAWVAAFGLSYVIIALSQAMAAIRRWRGVPYEAGIARAERLAGRPGRRVKWGPVTACFMGQSHLEATFAADFEAVRSHFVRLFGAPVELRRPLTVLVFERTEWYDLHLNGHLPMAGVYWMGIDRQIMICEELCLHGMTEPRWIWRQLLARSFFEQYKGFPPTPGLAGILACWLLIELDPCLTQRVHRRLQAMLRRGDPVGTIESLKGTDRQLVAAAVKQHERESFLTIAMFETQCMSLAEYLLGDAAGDRAERFRCLVRQWQRKDSLATGLPLQLNVEAAVLEQAWQRWILEHPSGSSGRPAPWIERYFQDHVLPQIVDDTMPPEQRALLIRHLGSNGFELGIDALIGLLEGRRAAQLHPDVVWTLESISGQLHGTDAAAWRQWWAERRKQNAYQRSVESAAGEPEVFLAQSADDEHVPVPPRRLKVLWGLLWLGGLIAVAWSVYFTLYLGQEFWYVSVLGILTGAYAMTRGTGTETRGLFAAAQLVTLNMILGNLPSCVIGLIATWQYRHPRVREYLRR